MKITRKTNMNEILMKRPELAGLFLSSGMGCMGCPMAQLETVEDGCRAHGMRDKDIDNLIDRLNKEEDEKKNKKGVKKK